MLMQASFTKRRNYLLPDATCNDLKDIDRSQLLRGYLGIVRNQEIVVDWRRKF